MGLVLRLVNDNGDLIGKSQEFEMEPEPSFDFEGATCINTTDIIIPVERPCSAFNIEIRESPSGYLLATLREYKTVNPGDLISFLPGSLKMGRDMPVGPLYENGLLDSTNRLQVMRKKTPNQPILPLPEEPEDELLKKKRKFKL